MKDSRYATWQTKNRTSIKRSPRLPKTSTTTTRRHSILSSTSLVYSSDRNGPRNRKPGRSRRCYSSHLCGATRRTRVIKSAIMFSTLEEPSYNGARRCMAGTSSYTKFFVSWRNEQSRWFSESRRQMKPDQHKLY